jgi:hypothetical protein
VRLQNDLRVAPRAQGVEEGPAGLDAADDQIEAAGLPQRRNGVGVGDDRDLDSCDRRRAAKVVRVGGEHDPRPALPLHDPIWAQADRRLVVRIAVEARFAGQQVRGQDRIRVVRGHGETRRDHR